MQLRTTKDVLNSFSATKFLENLLRNRQEIKIRSVTRLNILSRLKLDLTKLYKIVRTSYNIKNKI